MNYEKKDNCVFGEIIVMNSFSFVSIFCFLFAPLKADFHSPISGARANFCYRHLRTHGEYQITLQLYLLKMRALKCTHLLHNRNVFQGGKTNSLLSLKAKITAVIVRVAGGFASEIS